MEKKQLKIGLLPFIIITNIGLGITPALASISHYFKGNEASQVYLIVSIGALFGFFASLLAGKLQNYFTQKAVLLIGALLLSFGLLPVVFPHSFYLLLVVGALTGSGGGLLTATTPAMISRYSVNEERTALLGYKTGFQGLGTMLITFVGGVLAVYGWQYAYLIFILALVALGMGMVYLPSEGLKDGQISQGEEREGGKLGLRSPLVGLLLVLVIGLTLLSSSLSNNMALHADGLAIGDSSLVGLALSFQSFGVILAGFSMSWVVKVLRQRLLVVSFMVTSLGLASLAFFHHQLGLIGGALLFGYGYGLILTRLLFMMASLVKSQLIPIGMGLISACMSLGFALSPLLFNQLGTLFSTSLATTSFVLAFGLSVLLMLLLIVTNFEQQVLRN